MRHLRIGTRGSLLAKWQAEYVRKQLFAGAGVETEIVIIKTSGDKQHMSPLSEIGGKGIFIKELEEALLEDVCLVRVRAVGVRLTPVAENREGVGRGGAGRDLGGELR